MKQFLLLQPYSVWTSPLIEDAIKGGYIAKFTLSGGMYREMNSACVGISINNANKLLESRTIKPINEVK